MPPRDRLSLWTTRASRSGVTRADGFALTVLSILWLATCAGIGFHGEFPVSDGWAHAETVLGLVTTGEFVRSDWTWSPIITNVWLGALFSEMFGFSFETLRLSSLFSGWLGVVGTYGLCRHLGATPGRAAFGAAVYGWNPVHLALAFTFMTDVAFSALCVWALVLGLRMLRGVSWQGAVGALVLTVGAILSRQPGFALVGAFVIAYALRKVANRRALLLLGVGVAVTVAVSATVPLLISAEGDSGNRFTFAMFLERIILGQHAGYRLAVNGLTAALYLGAFLSPIAATIAPTFGRPGRSSWGAALAIAATLLAGLGWFGLPMPPGLDWVRDFGIGPIALAGATTEPELGPVLWWAVMGVAALSAGVVATALIRQASHAWPRPQIRAELALLVGFAAIPILVLALRAPFFDRYLVPSLAPLIAILAALPLASHRLGPRVVAGVLALGLGGFATLGTAGHLEHHRARSVLLDALVASGVPPRSVDGGNPFNGWHQFDLDEDLFLARPGRRWVLDDEYELGLRSSRPGYDLVASEDYWNPLGLREETVFLLHRASDGAPVELRLGAHGRAADVSPGAAYQREVQRGAAR